MKEVTKMLRSRAETRQETWEAFADLGTPIHIIIKYLTR